MWNKVEKLCRVLSISYFYIYQYLIFNMLTVAQGVQQSLMMIINCFCGMVDWRKAFSLISSREHCRRPLPSRIFNTPRAGFEPAQNLSSGLIEWSCAIMLTTTPQRHLWKFMLEFKRSVFFHYSRKYLKGACLQKCIAFYGLRKGYSTQQCLLAVLKRWCFIDRLF